VGTQVEVREKGATAAMTAVGTQVEVREKGATAAMTAVGTQAESRGAAAEVTSNPGDTRKRLGYRFAQNHQSCKRGQRIQ